MTTHRIIFRVEVSGAKWRKVVLSGIMHFAPLLSPWMGFLTGSISQEGRKFMTSGQQFRGRFELKVDPKFRLTLPSEFRDVLQSLRDSRLVITNSQYQNKKCLDVYPWAHWKKLEARISKLPQLKVEVQNFQRFYLSGGHDIAADGQNRILIPASLRTYAQIQSDVMVVGFSNKFEIWSLDIWNGLFENLAQDFGNTLAAVSNLEEKDGRK